MKKLIAIAVLSFVSNFAAFAQTNQTAAKKPSEEQKILDIFNEYLEAMQKDADERDRVREALDRRLFLYGR